MGTEWGTFPLRATPKSVPQHLTYRTGFGNQRNSFTCHSSRSRWTLKVPRLCLKTESQIVTPLGSIRGDFHLPYRGSLPRPLCLQAIRYLRYPEVVGELKPNQYSPCNCRNLPRVLMGEDLKVSEWIPSYINQVLGISTMNPINISLNNKRTRLQQQVNDYRIKASI